ncbi:hypothetical protein KP509_07G062000 [Ceratopteris richardii]|uniref:Uncharacterized protein n=1 Tax=Ceratopteris richardii TaxID=49495 RepID=A0A8T2UAG9_CERRI|nr:hypothetical protein KP509_07G062000 [Ceratopteris richardii]
MVVRVGQGIGGEGGEGGEEEVVTVGQGFGGGGGEVAGIFVAGRALQGGALVELGGLRVQRGRRGRRGGSGGEGGTRNWWRRRGRRGGGGGEGATRVSWGRRGRRGRRGGGGRGVGGMEMWRVVGVWKEGKSSRGRWRKGERW